MILNVLIIVLVIIIMLYTIIVYNIFIKLTKSVQRAESNILVYLKKRYDLIPNLIEIVKGYCNYEKNVIENIIKLRNNFNITATEETNKNLYASYKNIILVTESYPELKSSDNYLQIQKELSKTEDEIAATRRIYLSNIKKYNNLVKMFPSNIVGRIFGFKEIVFPKFINDENNIKK